MSSEAGDQASGRPRGMYHRAFAPNVEFSSGCSGEEFQGNQLESKDTSAHSANNDSRGTVPPPSRCIPLPDL